MIPMKNKAIELLESASLRRTQPRLAILTALLKAHAPLTQNQIAETIGGSAPNKTTIYRNLTHLVEKGLIHEAFQDHRSQYYELAHNCGKLSCHPHFTCIRCEQTHCMTRTHVHPVKLPEGYKIQRQQIRIEGICPKCAD